MNGKNLYWIIPLCLIVFGSIGYVKGGLDGANMMVEKCNSQYELSNALCGLDCALSTACIDMWEYYENKCPNIAREWELMTVKERQSELNKYGINNTE